MPFVGHGIDLVEIERVRRLLARHPTRFPDRCFTDAERTYADAIPGLRPQRYAARFAAKEAAAKALGTGLMTTIGWTDIEVRHTPSGRPTLSLQGPAAEHAAALGVTRTHLTLTHAAGLAVASVILE